MCALVAAAGPDFRAKGGYQGLMGTKVAAAGPDIRAKGDYQGLMGTEVEVVSLFWTRGCRREHKAI